MAAAAAPVTNGKAPEKPPREIFTQLSYGGTPRGRDGLATPDDFNRELADLPTRMDAFDEMGKSDDAIGSALEARQQEISSANWMLTPGEETDLGTQILEFVEDNLYPHLELLLRRYGKGPLQFGFTAGEPVFAWSDAPFVASIQRSDGGARPTRQTGERRIYLRKIAHIRNTAITGFTIAADGELLTLRQDVFDGDRYRRVDIPASKLLLRTYDREGDDYTGQPPIRRLYGNYKFKGQFERLALLNADRFSVGVPVLHEPEGGLSAAERKIALDALMAWRAGTSTALTLPHGCTIEIVTGEGGIAETALSWIQHYNNQGAKALTTQQTELGNTPNGSRALGETFAVQLGGSAQADCEAIADLFNNLLIVPLVDYNFGKQENYPTFSPSQRSATADFASIKEAVDSKIVTPRPEDEVIIRDALGLAEIDLETLKSEKDERDAKAAEIAKAATAAPGQPGAPGQPPKPADQKPPVKVAATRDAEPVRMLAQITPAEGAPAPAVPYETSYRTREFAMWEQRILRPDLLTQRLDLESTRLAAEVQHAFGAIDADLERQVKVAAEQGPVALKRAVSTIAVPEKLKRQLRAALIDSAERVREFGGTSVRSEILRQIGPENVGPARNTEPVGFFRRALERVKALAQGDAEPSMFDLHIEAEVDRVVENEIDRREASARSSALTAIASWSSAAAAAGISLASIVLSLIRDALADVSAGRTEDAARGVVNVAFGVGRTEEAQAINTIAGAAIPAAEKAAPSSSSSSITPGGEPAARDVGAGGGNRSGLVDADGNAIVLVAKIASAVMDFGTCDECAKWDGAQFPIDYPEDVTGVQCPNPRCLGGISRCRCIWIYVTNLEDVPLVPAAKGPLAA